ncbi:MAG: stage 0 sporulation family protein [Clostridiales bacterium]|nr:stage 0 sporulation family protein [Clostridiales bacterium]
MATIVGVRFKPVGKIYYFSPLGEELNTGDGVIVETARGIEYGKVIIPPKEIEKDKIVQPLKPIIRKATPEDEVQLKKNNEKRGEAMRIAREKIEKHGLPMKLIDCEYTFDNNKVIFYFMADGRVDFRDLVRDLASVFRKRIELRQIGIRDQSKMIGGLAPCGKQCCCAQYLTDFKHVSIKMAKIQLLSLNPSKISGLCGRLMCCLEFENDFYTDAFRKMPKVGSEVITPDGKGIVISNNLLKLETKVKIELPDGTPGFKDYKLEQIKAKELMAEDLPENGEGEELQDEEIKKLID